MAVVAVGLVGMGLSAGAESVTVEGIATQFAPAYTTVSVTLGGQSMGQVIAGAEEWRRVGGTTVFGPGFYTYCIELTQDIWDGGVFTFEIGALEQSPTPGELSLIHI